MRYEKPSPDYRKKYDKFEMMMNIRSAFAYYNSEAIAPVSQAEFTYYRLKEYCRENRCNWTKAEWRAFIMDMLTPLWACDLIDLLELND